MRFLREGPSIPDDLLEQRDLGNVVFFCGAGVSTRAGLPNFRALTARVLEKLGTSARAASRRAFDAIPQTSEAGGRPPEQLESPDLDRVFNLLQEEYGRERVEGTIQRVLAPARNADLAGHRAILSLSTDAIGRPHVVTTNFDPLFERAGRPLKVHVAPALPMLTTLKSFEGVVYLHGRCASSARPVDRLPLVISSSDLGRAYLAEGWATDFVRELLETYTIVLVGYRAADAPVRYLLEGLYGKADLVGVPRIYAFDRGPDEEVKRRWRSLGVHAIPYEAAANGAYARLWDTLTAWADRAADPDAWHQSIVALAQASPRELEPYQRGQVASILRTTRGAALFATAQSAPPAEWLCVLDSSIRRSRPRNGDDVDLITVYGLDDEPPRPEKTEDATTSPLADVDFLGVLKNDERSDHFQRVAGAFAGAGDRLPPRLANVAHWYTRVATEPLAIWWAAGYTALHRDLLANIRRRMPMAAEPASIPARAWRFLTEKFEHGGDDRYDWYRWRERLPIEGWSTSVLREFEDIVAPRVAVKRPFRRVVIPLVGAPGSLFELVDVDVAFPGHEREGVQIPREALRAVFGVVRRGLERAADLLAEMGREYWRTASFYGPGEGEGDPHLDEPSRFLHWARALFDRLAVEEPSSAVDEIRRWPIDKYFFNKLKIYAWANSELVAGDEVARGLTGLSAEDFWDSGHRRELLRTLRARWHDLRHEDRMSLETRILGGLGKWAAESEEEHIERARDTSVRMLGWLETHDCELSPGTLAALAALRPAGWTRRWDVSADGQSGITTAWGVTDTNPLALLDVPLAQVLTLSDRKTGSVPGRFTETAPFDGLVETYPRRALAALSLASRHGNYPSRYWSRLLSRWPQSAGSRLLRACAQRLARLPVQSLAEFSYAVTEWLRDNAARLAMLDSECAFVLIDRTLDALAEAGDAATDSALGEMSLGGIPQARSRRTHEYALNSPTGHLTSALQKILNELGLQQGAGIPSTVKSRLERLISMPGAAGDYAVCESAINLRWLHWLDPTWVRAVLIPRFDPSHPQAEPAWSAFLFDRVRPSRTLFRLLKPSFLALFEHAPTWRWPDSPFRFLAERLIVECYAVPGEVRSVSFAKARDLLRAMHDDGRAHAVWFMASGIPSSDADPDPWTVFVKPFLKRAWPLEKEFQTPLIAERLAFLAAQEGDHFPDVVDTIEPFLVPVDRLELTLHRAWIGGNEGSLAQRFPESMLRLLERLVPERPVPVPYGLDRTLEVIGNAAPALKADLRWRRLNRIIRGG